MRYGVFSDVHGNLGALRAVLDFYARNGVASFVCCGDLAGYGPQPLECVREVAALPNLTAVLGNHDAAVTGRLDVKWFNANAAAAIEYSRRQLDGEALDFLASLPEKTDAPGFTVAHGSPRKPLTEYLLSAGQYLESAAYWSLSPCFIGHSHMPMYFLEREGQPPENDFLAPLRTMNAVQGRIIFNPGSVGQPRDGDCRACCGIYDSSAATFEIFRVHYDVGATQAKMREAGLPEMLAERLSLGY